jgi:hypothetical protein
MTKPLQRIENEIEHLKQTPMPGAGTTNDENRVVAIEVESR